MMKRRILQNMGGGLNLTQISKVKCTNPIIFPDPIDGKTYVEIDDFITVDDAHEFSLPYYIVYSKTTPDNIIKYQCRVRDDEEEEYSDASLRVNNFYLPLMARQRSYQNPYREESGPNEPNTYLPGVFAYKIHVWLGSQTYDSSKYFAAIKKYYNKPKNGTWVDVDTTGSTTNVINSSSNYGVIFCFESRTITHLQIGTHAYVPVQDTISGVKGLACFERNEFWEMN